MTMPTLEVCVESTAGLAACVQGGADRIELCAALAVGGLTPSFGLMQAAARIDILSFAMMRPRDGDFVYSADEIAVICADIQMARYIGLSGVVLGASTVDRRLDHAALEKMRAACGDMPATLHRVIDTLADPIAAVSEAIDLGFSTILSSGAAQYAADGAAVLAEMQAEARNKITIMAGSGVTIDNVAMIASTGVHAFHASCSTATPNPEHLHTFGFAPEMKGTTDATKVAALKREISSL